MFHYTLFDASGLLIIAGNEATRDLERFGDGERLLQHVGAHRWKRRIDPPVTTGDATSKAQETNWPRAELAAAPAEVERNPGAVRQSAELLAYRDHRILRAGDLTVVVELNLQRTAVTTDVDTLD